MDSYTPITLPYFAPDHLLPAPLPTLNQVLSSTDYVVAPPGRFSKQFAVVRVGSHFLAKYGPDVHRLEGENMIFVSQQTRVPVPRVYAIYGYAGDATMIIMEYIEGVTLHNCLETLGPEELKYIGKKLRAQLNELRQIPAPDYYGALGRRPIIDFYKCRHHRPVFTHGDIHQMNVIVRPDGTPVLIDYESSGFYPAYRESLVASSIDRYLDFLDEKFMDEAHILSEALKAWTRARNEENCDHDCNHDCDHDFDHDLDYDYARSAAFQKSSGSPFMFT
ncbi:hypothetical protein GQX73_g3323 [Xylaria multiplex]|uniref:Aminoglycoside phosphotransferase domain-containing protein n=1 Tax=Xylaria multiplex TaxID=323545 RepID=A0A7C8MX68_9PEZI|nr:hypothetical protein GQX73_g3323 [Xylaria multiplex]